MPPKQQTDNTAMRELKKALRQGGLKNLYVFYGDETFLREYYLGELKKAILPQGMEDFNLHTAQGKECSVDWIAQAVDCLAGHRLRPHGPGGEGAAAAAGAV